MSLKQMLKEDLYWAMLGMMVLIPAIGGMMLGHSLWELRGPIITSTLIYSLIFYFYFNN